jgi:hypothetical protein
MSSLRTSPRNMCSKPGGNDRLSFSLAIPRTALSLIIPLISLVEGDDLPVIKRPESENDHNPTSSADVKNAWS